MNRRVSFLIGLDGRILLTTDAAGTAAHLAEMRDAIAEVKIRRSYPKR